MSVVPDAADNAGLTVTPFQSFLGWRVLRWEAGLCELALDLEPQHLNRTGVVHGGVVMTLLDTASGLAAGHTPDATQPHPTVTISLTCNFIAPSRAGRLIALGRVEGGGTRVLSTSASLRAEDGRLLATAVGSFRRFIRPSGGATLTPTVATPDPSIRHPREGGDPGLPIGFAFETLDPRLRGEDG